MKNHFKYTMNYLILKALLKNLAVTKTEITF